MPYSFLGSSLSKPQASEVSKEVNARCDMCDVHGCGKLGSATQWRDHRGSRSAEKKVPRKRLVNADVSAALRVLRPNDDVLRKTTSPPALWCGSLMSPQKVQKMLSIRQTNT